MRIKENTITRREIPEVPNIPIPAFFAKRMELEKIIETLALRPIYTIASNDFIARLSVLLEAIDQFFAHEEQLLDYYDVPQELRRTLFDDHQKIRNMLQRVHSDSIGKKNQTAFTVYEAIKQEIERHIANFSFDVAQYAPLRMH